MVRQLRRRRGTRARCARFSRRGAAPRRGECISPKRASRPPHGPCDDGLGEWLAAFDEHDPRVVVEYLVHETSFLFFAGSLPVARTVERALADPASDPEETLRLHAPVPSLNRVVRRETTMAGTRVSAGTVVELDWRSANRDPERPQGRHVSFGHGPHRCLGAALARIEIAAARDAFGISDDLSHI